jgi:L-ascorbate metabolism protein UlaG (beta-lactamase superfamily)
MELTWYGHAAFLLEGEAGDGATSRVMLDPYRAPDVGTYAPIDDVADVVAISHVNEKYHSHTASARPRPGGPPVEVVDGLALLDGAQPVAARGVPFTAVRVWENEKRDEPIAMVGVTVGGVRFLHMGDCGHALAPEEVAACGPTDVLLALAGGPPTLELSDLLNFVRALAPRVVVPMHFLNDRINLKLRPVADFLALLPAEIPVRHFDSPTVTVTPESLPARTEVWVLPPAR